MRLLKSKKRCMEIRVSVVFVLGLVDIIYNIQRGLPLSSQGAYIIILIFSSWAYYRSYNSALSNNLSFHFLVIIFIDEAFLLHLG